MIQLRTRLAVLFTSVLLVAAFVLPTAPANATGAEVEVLGVSASVGTCSTYVHAHNYNGTTGHTHILVCIK